MPPKQRTPDQSPEMSCITLGSTVRCFVWSHRRECTGTLGAGCEDLRRLTPLSSTQKHHQEDRERIRLREQTDSGCLGHETQSMNADAGTLFYTDERIHFFAWQLQWDATSPHKRVCTALDAHRSTKNAAIKYRAHCSSVSVQARYQVAHQMRPLPLLAAAAVAGRESDVPPGGSSGYQLPPLCPPPPTPDVDFNLDPREHKPDAGHNSPCTVRPPR